MALVMVMGLALLVYALAEHKLRTALQERGESVPNQVGKPTQRPTMRRVFQMFEGIDSLVLSTPKGVQQQVLNLKPASSAPMWKNAIWTPVRCGIWALGFPYPFPPLSPVLQPDAAHAII